MQVVASVLVLVWMGMVVVAVIGLVRGRLRWARIGSRRTAGWVLAASVPVFVVAGLVAPKQDSMQPALASTPASNTAPTTTSAPVSTPTTTASTSATTTVAPTSTIVVVPSPTATVVLAPPPTQSVDAPTVVPAPPVMPVAPAPVAPSVAAPVKSVTPGAFCSPAGATGTSKTGKHMVCDVASDGRFRWQQG